MCALFLVLFAICEGLNAVKRSNDGHPISKSVIDNRFTACFHFVVKLFVKRRPILRKLNIHALVDISLNILTSNCSFNSKQNFY